MVFLYTGVPFSVLFCVLLLKCSDFQQFLTIKRSSATLNRTEPSPNYHLHYLSFSFFDTNDFTLKWSKVQRLKTDNAKTQCFTRCQDLKKKKKTFQWLNSITSGVWIISSRASSFHQSWTPSILLCKNMLSHTITHTVSLTSEIWTNFTQVTKRARKRLTW